MRRSPPAAPPRSRGPETLRVRTPGCGRCRCLLRSLVGCSSLQGTGDKGYISGEGEVVEVEPGRARGRDRADRRRPPGRPAVDLADFRGKPVVVTVVGGRGARPAGAEAPEVAEVAAQTTATAQFVGINIRDAAPEQGEASSGPSTCPTRRSSPRTARRCSPSPGTLTPNRSPRFVVLDAEGRVAASIIGQLPSQDTLVEVVEDVVAEPGARPMGEWFHDQRGPGSLAPRHAGRAGGRTGLLLLARA